MSSLSLQSTQIAGVYSYSRNPLSDNRGSFQRLFCRSLLESVGLDDQICQINHSYTQVKGCVRGLHMQIPPSEEMKIVSCIRGSIFDVAVDLRKNSKTYLQYHAQILDDKNHCSLVIPWGCAHGFQTLSDSAELIYLHTTNYDKNSELGINPFDQSVNIKWPEVVTEVSGKDKNASNIKELNL